MKKKNSSISEVFNQNTTYQFVCYTCRPQKKGTKTTDGQLAKRQAAQHYAEKPGHNIDILITYNLKSSNNFKPEQ